MTWEENAAYLAACLPPVAPWLSPEVRELRVRAGSPALVASGNGIRFTDWVPDARRVEQAAEALCGHSLYARREEARQGSLVLRGGHRLGLCGRVSLREGQIYALEEISSFCLRLAGQWPGAADGLMALRAPWPRSVLAIGPPGSGKTTFLRDLCRQWALAGIQAAVNDQRGELAALYQGTPQLDVGPCTDVLEGCGKGAGLWWLLRSMSPQVIFTDELDGRGDAGAVREALRCGIKLCASAHGESLNQVRARPGIGSMLAEGLFDLYVVLAGCRIEAIYSREELPWG